MKTDYEPFKIGTVFNPIPIKVKNNFPVLKSVEVLFPSRLNAMAIDPGRIASNKNMVYSAGEIVFSLPIFKRIKVNVISSRDVVISENSRRKPLIRHAFLIMKKAISFDNGLYIEVENSGEVKHQGLGSSSSLLAGVCAAINEIYGCPINQKELLKYVAQNHGEEIEGNNSELNPVQCIGGSAASGLYEGGVILVLGKNLVAKTANIPQDYSIVLGFPKDFKEIDSKVALEKEFENINNFIECGKKYGETNAYNVLHKFIPAMIESDIEKMGEVIYDYRYNMGSIKNCSFLYPKLVQVCDKVSILKKERYASILSISSVGPLIFAITKNPEKCQEIFEKENLKTEIFQVYNGKYRVVNFLRYEDVFWDEQSSFFSDKLPCNHIIKILKKFDKRKGNKLLDVGCGGGRNLISRLGEGFDVYGIDYSNSMIKKVRQKLSKHFSLEEIKKRILKKNIFSLSEIDEKFNVVIASGIIHQAKSKKELKEIIFLLANALKREGILVGNLFTSDYLDSEMNCIGENVYITKEGLYMTLVTKDEFLEICKENGLYPKTFQEEIKDVGTGKRAILRFELEKF
ncbi:MAG: methyltransferase domain-containing protein [archaeon]